MAVMTGRTVGELAVENPAATRVFEKFGIDYCCGGNQSLDQACERAGVSIDQVLDTLKMDEDAARSSHSALNWQNEPLSELIAHIQSTHHKFVREETARLTALLQKVVSVHGKNHPELLDIQATFAALVQELTTHLMKEEMVLFPYVIRMEEAIVENEPVVPAPFGTVANPVAMMEHEHDSAGNALRAMRQASNGYVAPADACVSYQTSYQALAAFEADLHQHIHLENNVLFPRAIAMEKGR
ncbi:MAG TPA: iron-sulfur cluster repair di-iron protein [Terriglobales bacterium]|nr:iron-sulfur cluster repair di-iron protein [Terriglobales bacterium]